MVLLMVTMLCVPTFASTATGDITLTYDLKSGGSNDIVVHTGDVITVSYSLSASESTRVSATQNEIYYDTDFFELVPDSISDSEGFEDYITTNTERQNGSWYVFFATAVTHVHDMTPSEIGTIQLKVIAEEGETTVANTNYGASDSKNEHYGTAAQNLHVRIGTVPEYDVEVIEDYVADYNMVLVYTDDESNFRYDGTAMYDVTGAGYTYGEEKKSYSHVYAIVVKGENPDVMKEKVTLDMTAESETLNCNTLDVNESGSVDLYDAVATVYVYHSNSIYMNGYQSIVLKADVNHDKKVDMDDFYKIKEYYLK
jgi:hypothetical protein